MINLSYIKNNIYKGRVKQYHFQKFILSSRYGSNWTGGVRSYIVFDTCNPDHCLGDSYAKLKHKDKSLEYVKRHS